MAFEPNPADWQKDVDAAHVIIREANLRALEECRTKGLNCACAYMALIQEGMMNYATLAGSDLEAIRQIRNFCDDWERDAEAPDLH